jgi:hypothetical protein
MGRSVAEAAALSVVSTVTYVATLAVSGALGDRAGHRRALRLSTGFQMATAAAVGVAMMFGGSALPLLVILSLTIGAGRSFTVTSTYAATGTLISSERMPLAFAQLTIARHIGVFGGPALGAVIYGLGRAPALVIAVIVACALAWLFSLDLRDPYQTPVVISRESWRRRLNRVVGDRQMRLLLVAGFVWNLPTGAALSLAVPLMHNRVHLSSFSTGVVLGVGVLGSIAVSPLMRALGGGTDLTRLSVRGIAVQAGTLILIAAVVNLVLLIPLYGLMMMSNATVDSNLQTARVQNVPIGQQATVVGTGMFVGNLGYVVSGGVAVLLASVASLAVIFVLLGASMMALAVLMHWLLLRPAPPLAVSAAGA